MPGKNMLAPPVLKIFQGFNRWPGLSLKGREAYQSLEENALSLPNFSHK
jgi:hypothetical protein